jgi:hypothetical protein
LMEMLQDVTRTDFRDWTQENVLSPLGMNESTFALDLPVGLSCAAVGHDTSGNPIPGLRNLYPEASAAGLYTNAGDLCQTIIMLNAGGVVDGTEVLAPGQASTMLAEGLGIFTSGQSDEASYMFNHNGEKLRFHLPDPGLSQSGRRDRCHGQPRQRRRQRERVLHRGRQRACPGLQPASLTASSQVGFAAGWRIEPRGLRRRSWGSRRPSLAPGKSRCRADARAARASGRLANNAGRHWFRPPRCHRLVASDGAHWGDCCHGLHPTAAHDSYGDIRRFAAPPHRRFQGGRRGVQNRGAAYVGNVTGGGFQRPLGWQLWPLCA